MKYDFLQPGYFDKFGKNDRDIDLNSLLKPVTPDYTLPTIRSEKPLLYFCDQAGCPGHPVGSGSFCPRPGPGMGLGPPGNPLTW